MAKNDYFVIAYKILKYLYECLQQGKPPCVEEFCHNSQLFGIEIPESYWQEIIAELHDKGYIKGVMPVRSIGVSGIKFSPDLAITMTGVEFLTENDKMKKVQGYVGKGFETLLKLIIG